MGLVVKYLAGVQDIRRIQQVFQTAHNFDLVLAARAAKPGFLVEADAVFGGDRTAQSLEATVNNLIAALVVGSLVEGCDEQMQVAVGYVTENQAYGV